MSMSSVIMAQRIKHFSIYRNARKFSISCVLLKSLVTTPIFYVNGPPHIGHLYTAVLADAYHRFNKLQGDKHSYLVTGTDEHGVKVKEAAGLALMKPSEFCDKISAEYKTLFQQYGIQFSEFIRTTDDKHKSAVRHFWTELSNKGYIHEGKYSGWYCKADEAFLTDLHVKKLHGSEKLSNLDKPIYVSAETGHSVEWTDENNFVFPLGKMTSDLLHWLKDEKVVQPAKFHNTAVKMISALSESETLSLSRPSFRVDWGIRVPGCEDQTIYVWLDALVNYLTAAGYPDKEKVAQSWPPKVQVIGKDILRFHTMYWPAFLIAAGMEPPRKIIVHSHWTVDMEKMSKSSGNVVAPPQNVSSEFITSFRYFLLRFGTPHHDNDFNTTKISSTARAELGTLGNLLNRCTSEKVNVNQDFPAYDEATFDNIARGDGAKLIESVNNLADEVQEQYEGCNFYQGLQSVMHTVHLANEFIQREKPWSLAKGAENYDRLRTVLHIALESVRVCSIALQPIVPELADTALTKLAVDPHERSWNEMRQVTWLSEGHGKTHKLAVGKVCLYAG